MPEQGSPRRVAEPKGLVGYYEVLCNERDEAVQGKACHRRVKELNGGSGSEMRPANVRERERYAGRQCLGEKGQRALYLDVDIRHRPRKDVHAPILICADEHALQWLSVLRSVGVSHDMWNESWDIIAASMKPCYNVELGESW